ncbi:MAG: DUF4469 domain-containing protein [Carboxylicivirga sp.]|jgi:hypothetical protein|nr:DUF4469 domain-containing protein [Carboxylicivirga sp.]
MPLKYKLIRSNLKSHNNGYIATPVSRKTVTQNDLIERMCQQGSGISRGEAMANIEAYHQELCNALLDGDIYVSEMFTIQSSIAGVFENHDSRFTKGVNEVKIKVQPGKRLKKLASQINTRRKSNEGVSPIISSIKDINRQPHPMHDQAGGFMIIKGKRLKINEEDEQQGLFFISHTTGQAYKTTKLIGNKPKELMLLLPDMPVGEYMIELRVVFRNSRMLRKVKYLTLFTVS